MPIVGIYTKDFPSIGRALLDTDILVVAVVGETITYQTTVGALRTALKISITAISDASGEYDLSATAATDTLVCVYEGDNTVPASYNKSTKILSGLNASTTFTAKFI